MKTPRRFLAAALGATLSLAPARAAATAAADPKPAEKSDKKELRVITSGDRVLPRISRGAIVHRLDGEKESVTFLGVETAPVSATLVAQLGLPEGQGLVVNHVVADSPAAAALKPHDILLKLDDQILIEQRQLSVLVRSRKEGDEVTLTYLRAGKQATAKVKLAKHEVPKVSTWEAQLPGGGGAHAFAFGGGSGDGGSGGLQIMPFPGQPRTGDEVDRFLGLMNNGAARPGMQLFRQTMPGDRSVSVTINTGNSRVVLDDEKGTLELAIKDGRKEVVAKNPAGEQVFAGPVNTPEERKALPADVRTRLEKLEDSTQFRFRTDNDFKGAETRLWTPRGQGIGLPREPAPVPERARANLFL